MTPEEFWSILHDVPAQAQPEYRLYHDDQGHPLFYSMEDLPGNYIVIDQKTFNESPSHVRVVDGEIKILGASKKQRKLSPGSTGTACNPRDVCIVVPDTKPNIKWKVRHES